MRRDEIFEQDIDRFVSLYLAWQRRVCGHKRRDDAVIVPVVIWGKSGRLLIYFAKP
jgi:hypothetical protein